MLNDKPMYFNTECIEFKPRFRWKMFFPFFNTLELNYTLMYARRGVCDLSQVDCSHDNILLA